MSSSDSIFSSKEGRIQFCQDCLEKGYLDLAVRELMKGLNLFPDDPDIYFFLGAAFDSRGERDRKKRVCAWADRTWLQPGG